MVQRNPTRPTGREGQARASAPGWADLVKPTKISEGTYPEAGRRWRGLPTLTASRSVPPHVRGEGFASEPGVGEGVVQAGLDFDAGEGALALHEGGVVEGAAAGGVAGGPADAAAGAG